MASIKRDDSKQKWEETEFPLVCETCLGDNPYVRMTKEAHGKKCKVCDVPFTVFAWQAGTRGRLKKVEICRTCARTKNVCQVCIFDLQYGLPVQVRDRVLAEEGDMASVALVPHSDANRAWFTAQQERAVELGQAGAVPGAKAAARLESMARMEPRYERNLAKLCSFFARGECNRGSRCPFRHELPKDRNDPLSKQNTRDRFYGMNDPVAEKMLEQQKERAEQLREEAKARGEEFGDERSVSTLYVRFQDQAEGAASIPLTSMDVRDKFYSFGEISAVRMHADKGAFVEYTTRQAADLALTSMSRGKAINGRSIFVSWARQPKRGNLDARQQQQPQQSVIGPVRPMPPPGGAGPKSLPSGFAPMKPSAEVAAAVAAATSDRGKSSVLSTKTTAGSLRSAGALPRAGGGVIRRAGVKSSGDGIARPYYPSSDPARLGSRVSTAPPPT